MNGRRLADLRPTMSSGILGSLASRSEMTDNVREEDVRDPGMDVTGEGFGGRERAYEGDIQNEAYSSNSLREVNIKPLNSGYLVNVGCQSVAVETTETLLKALGEYLNNPTGFERAWNNNPNRNKL